MSKLISMVMACMLCVAVFAEDIKQTVDASADGRVDVSNIAGSVTVVGWDRNAVEVTGTLGRNVEKLVVKRDGRRVKIKVKVPQRGGRGIDSKLRIRVPQGSSLDIGTVSADIDVSMIAGEQNLHTVSGDMSVEHAGADVSAESVSGDVAVSGSNAEGELRVASVSGNVSLSRVSGDIEIESVSGDVSVDEGIFARARLESVSGDIEFRGKLHEDGKLRIETVNGDVDMDFDAEVSAEFNLDTFNGKIRNCFGPKAQRSSQYAPGWELLFTQGAGAGQVYASTLNGSVSICNK